MKNGVQNLMIALALLAWPLTTKAQFGFATDNGAITITGYAGSDRVVAIPSSINGHPVTKIGNLAFVGRADLTSVTIPESVTSIGNLAFERCTGLTSFTVAADNPAYSSGDGILFDR